MYAHIKHNFSYCKNKVVNMKVLKFGGKSLESKEKIWTVCEYIQSLPREEKLVVVVSAMGNATNELLEKSYSYYSGKPNLRELDVLLSTGETQCASLVAMCLNSLKVKAISLQAWQIELRTMGKAGESIVTGINKSTITKKLDTYDVVVVAGFQGVNSAGDITTLGRGGSDTSAVALGSVLNCEVEIFSNYDGVFAGDPKDLNFKKLPQVDYNDMLFWSNNNAKVMSSASADIAMQAQVCVKCKQSVAPNKSGTHICNVPQPIISLTSRDDLCEINVLCTRDASLLEKTAKFIVNNVKYYKFYAKNNKITLLLDKKQKIDVLSKIAKINKLLEVK